MKETTIHPLGLAAVLILGLLMLMVPRRWALLPMILTACFICQAQQVVVFGFTFTLIRLMVVFGAARLFVRGETQGIRWLAVDTLIICWTISGTIAYTLLLGTFAAFQFRLGQSFDSLGMYFVFRFLVRDWEDLTRVVVGFSVVSVPTAFAFLIEHVTGRNMFSIFGGVPAITRVREGRLRCQGAFSHEILAGCFWAAVMPPMFALLLHSRAHRQLGLAGLACCTCIIIMCASSTPVAAVMFAVVAMLLFPVRANLRWIRRGGFFLLVFLHFWMKNPVWHLISRIDLVGGSTGWHRYFLIDSAIRRVNEWWLIGTQSTAHWGWMMYDITNQYVLEGVRGGMLTLLLFVTMIGLSYRSVGRILRAVVGDRRKTLMAWTLGVSLFVHCTNFIAVSYFGQITMLTYLALALISSIDALETSPASGTRLQVGLAVRAGHGVHA